jgi:hypothetical protein
MRNPEGTRRCENGVETEGLRQSRENLVSTLTLSQLIRRRVRDKFGGVEWHGRRRAWCVDSRTSADRPIEHERSDLSEGT